MGGLTQIHLDLDGQHLYVLVRGVGFSRNIGYILVVGLRTYTYHEVRGTGMNYLPLIPLSLQTSYCALLLHVYASRQLYSGTCHRGKHSGTYFKMENYIHEESLAIILIASSVILI